MRSVMTIVLITLTGAILLESQGARSPGADECGASGLQSVRITAQQLSEAPPSYAFLVTNLAQVPITGIVVGRHDRTLPITSVAPNIPVRMDSPPGWEGRHVFVEETPYMVYLWENKDPSKRIMPQQSAAGFRISLPEAKKDPAQVTFARIPFKASLADGSCRWGLVGVDTISK
jgi:hypothetical protein